MTKTNAQEAAASVATILTQKGLKVVVDSTNVYFDRGDGKIIRLIASYPNTTYWKDGVNRKQLRQELEK